MSPRTADPAARFAEAVSAVYADAGGAPEWRLRGERLRGGRVRMSVTNVARGETWPVDMTAADARALAAGLNGSAG